MVDEPVLNPHWGGKFKGYYMKALMYGLPNEDAINSALHQFNQEYTEYLETYYEHNNEAVMRDYMGNT